MTDHDHLAWDVVATPLGPLTLQAGVRGLRRVRFGDESAALDPRHRCGAALGGAARQIDEYLRGARHGFDLALDLRGTPFQRAVWAQLRRVPYGATVSYGELARRAGRPGAARAAGAAVGRTPVAIVVPCHRAVGAGGALTGYAGGLDRKRALLELEGALPALAAA